ncbi:hypothetical protein PanWU01x14_332950 [Parasponia andersonii]|uniref:Uncharacterized protein n=1 Tax=Parasponia andersonii TaxID=3476 RepID=A0A2P5AH22_PARAD|nr:hypothetical protein PanWU01x14_332950 [Parasponia andersonii]
MSVPDDFIRVASILKFGIVCSPVLYDLRSSQIQWNLLITLSSGGLSSVVLCKFLPLSAPMV